MSIALYIGDSPVALKKDFSIEFEFNELVFTDNLEVGAFSVPIDLPIEGNEDLFGFSNLIRSERQPKTYDNCRYYEFGNLKYQGQLIVLKAKNEKYFRVAFIINAMGLAIRDKKLNELPIERLFLGNNDTEVVAAAMLSEEEPKPYCFPPITGFEFYDNPASIAPTNVDINELVVGWDNADFTKPIVPFFFLTQLTDMIVRSLGFTPSGSFFEDGRMQKIAVSNMACLENEHEETGWYAELPNMVQVTTAGNPAVFSSLNIYVLEEWQSLPLTSVTPFHIELNLKFASLLWEKKTNITKVRADVTYGDTTWVRYGYEYNQHKYKYRAQVKVYISENGTTPDGTDVLVFSGTSDEISPINNATLPNFEPSSSDGWAHISVPDYTPAASDIGSFVRVEVSIEVKETIYFHKHIGNGNFYNIPVNVPLWTATDNYLREGNMRFTYDLAGNLLAHYVDFNQLLPSVNVSDFFLRLIKTYCLKPTFRPDKKEIILDLCRDALLLDAQDWAGQVQANPEMVYDLAPKGFTIKQGFDSAEVDPDVIEGFDFMGNYPNEASLPDQRHNNYLVNDENNMIYLPRAVTTVGTVNQPGWAAEYNWVKEQWFAPITVLGDGSKQIEVGFLPLVYDPADTTQVSYFGKGKSRSLLRSESSEEFFRSINYVHQFTSDANGDPTVPATPLSGPLSFSGQAYLLNYSNNQVDSLFTNLFADWLGTMMQSRELECDLVDGHMDELLLSLRDPKKLDGLKFFIKKYRRSIDAHGWAKIKATLIQISS